MYSSLLALTLDLSTATPYLVFGGLAIVVALTFRYVWSNKSMAKKYLPALEELLKKGMQNTTDVPDKLDVHDVISVVHNLAHYASQTVNDPENSEWSDVKDEVIDAVKDGLKNTQYEGVISDKWIERIAAGALISAEHLPKILHGKLKEKEEPKDEDKS